MEKILYVSDLDGTLLQSNQMVSDFTALAINTLAEQGMLFSYATARSFITASKAASKITAKIPLVIYNGTFVLDNSSGKMLLSNYFSHGEVQEIAAALYRCGVYPMVYSFINGAEKFSYCTAGLTKGLTEFLNTRQADVRDNPVNSRKDLYKGDVFYFTLIDDEEKLLPLYMRFKNRYSCIYSRDIYSGNQWLEIMPSGTNKANAILKLKELLGCTKIISFGDAKNDIPMFEISDECYAVENADDRLKEIATAVIGSNNDDGVAKWLLRNVK